MGVPKKKMSTTRRDKRRTHDRLTAPNLASCPQCGEPRIPHRICGSCGHYRGETRLAVDA